MISLPSYAFCVTSNDFVDAADFHAMAINFAIEKEMEDEQREREYERNFDLHS